MILRFVRMLSLVNGLKTHYVTVTSSSRAINVKAVHSSGVKMALTLLSFLMTQFMTLTTQQATSKTLAYYLMAQPIR